MKKIDIDSFMINMKSINDIQKDKGQNVYHFSQICYCHDSLSFGYLYDSLQLFSFIIHFSHTQWVLWMTYLSMGHVSRSLIPTHCERAGLWTHVPCWGFVNVCKLYLLFKQFTYIYKPPVLFCIPNIFPYYF